MGLHKSEGQPEGTRRSFLPGGSAWNSSAALCRTDSTLRLAQEIRTLAVSLHPRHPSQIREENKFRRRDRPSILGNNTRLQFVVVVPAIVTALAIYLALFFVNRVLHRFADEQGWGAGAADGSGESEVLIREVEGVSTEPLVIEQAPPPSPERVVEELYRERNEAQRAALAVEKPVLMPVLEPEPLPLEPIGLRPLPMPAVAQPAVEATTREEAPHDGE